MTAVNPAVQNRIASHRNGSELANQIDNANVRDAGSKGKVKLKNGDLTQITAKNFVTVDSENLKQKLRFNQPEPQQPDHDASKEEISKYHRDLKEHSVAQTHHVHELAWETGRAGEEPSVKKFVDRIKTKIRDSVIGRFIKRNILNHLTKPQVEKMEVKGQVDQNTKQTTLTFELKSVKSQEQLQETDPLHLGTDGVDHTIEVSFDRLRNQRAWYNPKRWFNIDQAGRDGKISNKLAKLKDDISRQVRLRNLGIGLQQERNFQKDASGLLASLPESAGKKGIEPPKVADYSNNELQAIRAGVNSLKNIPEAMGGLNKDECLTLLDKAQRGEQLSKPELRDLRSLTLLMEIEKLEAIDQAAGDYAFTQGQTDDLKKLKEALVEDIQQRANSLDTKSNNSELDRVILSTSRSMREMSIMCWAGLQPPSDADHQDPSNQGDSYLSNYNRLLAGKQEGIIPQSLLMKPYIYSPQALRQQAAIIRDLAETDAAKHAGLITGLTNIEDQISEMAAQRGNDDPDLHSHEGTDRLQMQVTGKKEILEEIASHYESLAENTSGFYRFQGMLPILARNNGEDIEKALQYSLEDSLEQSTGLSDGGNNRGRQVIGYTLMGLGAVDAIARGNVFRGAAVAAAGGAAVAAGGPSENTTKYREREGMLIQAILQGIVSGSEEQLIKSNRLIAEENLQENVKKWSSDRHYELVNISKKIDDKQEIRKISKSRDDLISGSTNRDPIHQKIKDDISNKINDTKQLVEDANQIEAKLRSGPDKTVKVHDKLTLDKADYGPSVEVKESLGKACNELKNESTALLKSFEILEGAYVVKNDPGSIHQPILNLEEKVAKAFAGDDRFKNNGIDDLLLNDVEQIRENVTRQGESLTNDHATHLHDLVDAVGTSVEKAAEVKKTMIEMAQGLASPNLAFMSGTLDRDVFEREARFDSNGQFDAHFQTLKSAREAVGDRRTNPYSLFRDQETRKAMTESLTPLIQDAESSKKAWDKCLITSSAMVESAIDPKNIHKLKENLTRQKATLVTESQDLKKIATKYQGLTSHPEEFNFDNRINDLQSRCLREGTARLIVLPTPPDQRCQMGLDILAGPLEDTTVHDSITRYLMNFPGDQKAEKFAELFQDFPEATNPQDWTEEMGETWKGKISQGSALDFIKKLHRLDQGGDELSNGLNLAKKLSNEEGLKELTVEIYTPAINSSIDKAVQNEDLATIFENSLTRKNLMSHLAGNFDKMLRNGFDEELNKNNKTVAGIYDKFSNSSSRGELTANDLETLLKFTTAMGNLKENAEATEQHLVTVATTNLLHNVDGSIDTKDPKNIDSGKLKEVFQPKPTNIGEWEKFKVSHKATEDLYKGLQLEAESATDDLNGSKNLFLKNGGLETLLAPSDKKILRNREILLKARQNYNSYSWLQKLETDHLQKKGKVLNAKDLKREIDASGIDFVRLKYIDPKTCDDQKLKDFARRLDDEPVAANLFRNFRAQQFGAGIHDHKPASQEVIDHLNKYKKGINQENPADTLRRMFVDPVDSRINDRLTALQNYIDADKNLKEISPQLEKATRTYKNLSGERDALLEKYQTLAFKNSVRAAILTYCSQTGTRPSTLQNDPHEEKIKHRLKDWGWDPATYPIAEDIGHYMEEASTKDFLKEWTKEAGNNRSELGRIENQIEIISAQMQESLLTLKEGIKEAQEANRVEMDAESKSLSNEAGALLVATRAHRSNDNLANFALTNSTLAEKPLNQLVENLEASHASEKLKIQEWKKEVLGEIDSLNDWKEVSKLVHSKLEKLHDDILGLPSAQNSKASSRPSYYTNLTSRRALLFDRLAHAAIAENHEKVVTKAVQSIEEIERARSEYANLTVSDSLPSNMITDENGKPHNWVNLYADKKHDPEKLAKDWNNMHPTEFLAKFQEDGELYKHFNNQNKKENFQALTAQMQKLSAALEGIEKSLSSPYEETSYKRELSSSHENVGKFQGNIGGIKEGKIHFNSSFTSLGKILEDPKSYGPVIQALEKCQIDTKNVSIKSETVYHQTNQQLEENLRELNQQYQDIDDESVMAEDEGEDSEGYDFQDSGLHMSTSLSAPHVSSNIQQQLESILNAEEFNLALLSGAPLSSNPNAQTQVVEQSGALPANPGLQSMSNLTYKVYGGDTERGKVQNGIWTQLSEELKNNLGFAKDYVHAPVEAGGYCLLTALASVNNMSTSELQKKIEDTINQSGKEGLKKKWEDEKLKSRGQSRDDIGSSGLDPHALVDVFAAVGIKFNIVSSRNGLYGIQGINGDPVERDPTLFHSDTGGTGHFDLLIPRNVAIANKVPHDGSQYIAKK